MNDIVQSGKARYWAVSNWKGELLDAACGYAERHGRHPPIVNQIEYNALHRATAAAAMQAVQARGLGLAVWGPLAGGLLSGKYLRGTPAKSRGADPAMQGAGITARLVDAQRNALVAEMARIAAEIGCTVGQLAIGWCLVQPQVSTVLIAASNLAQLEENLGALTAAERLTPEVLARIAAVVGDYDQSNIPEALPAS